jgi:hypothetical protein
VLAWCNATCFALNACSSCHMEHNATAPARMLRPANPPVPGTDTATQDCMTCHGGGTLLAPAAPNVMAEIAKISHPLPAGTNFHDVARNRCAQQQSPCHLCGLSQCSRIQSGGHICRPSRDPSLAGEPDRHQRDGRSDSSASGPKPVLELPPLSRYERRKTEIDDLRIRAHEISFSTGSPERDAAGADGGHHKTLAEL